MLTTTRVRSLPVNPSPGTVLHCPQCEADYSADRSDYCAHEPHDELRCGCGSRLMLAVAIVIHEARL